MAEFWTYASRIGTVFSIVGGAFAPVVVLQLADARRQLLEEKYEQWSALKSQIQQVVPPGQDRSESALKVATFYRENKEKPSASATIQLIDQSRTLGRAVLKSGDSLITQCLLSRYMKDHGYAQLFNVMLATAPLDAVNGLQNRPKIPQEVPLDNFGVVLSLNIELEDRASYYLVEDVVPSQKNAFGDADLKEWTRQVDQFLNTPKSCHTWIRDDTWAKVKEIRNKM